MSIMTKSLLISFILIGLFSCVKTSSKPPFAPKLPKASPIRAVEGYLDALKRNNFNKAYNYITFMYAGNVDKEGYVLNMKNSLGKINWNLLNYEIQGVRILGLQAFVTAELNVHFKPPDKEESVEKTVDVQYILFSKDNKWKINADDLIEKDLTSPNSNEGRMNVE